MAQAAGEEHEVKLVDAALMAPLGALVPHAGTAMIHAVTMEGIVRGWEGGDLVSACGQPVKLMAVPIGSEEVVPWPPEARSLPHPFKRCVPCQKATGNKRPRCKFANAGGIR